MTSSRPAYIPGPWARRLAALLLTGAAALAWLSPQACADTRAQRQARREIAQGNKLYNDKRYAEAEVAYTKALEAEPSNATAQVNLASAYVRQAMQGEAGDELRQKAQGLYAKALAEAPKDSHAAQQAAYNLGNMAFNREDYKQAVDYYKEALRRDPSDDKARDNLRLALLRLKQQEQNQDQNKDQDKQDQQQNQDKQDQQQDQNKDQDKQQDQNKQDQQQNQDQDKQDQQQQQQQRPQGLSQENAEKILKAMENEEAATRRKVQEAEKKEKEKNARRTVSKPW